MSSARKGSADLLSNALFLTDTPIADYIRGAVGGKLPDFLLPVFLHEGAHHWCLSGTIGETMAVIDLETQRQWGKSPGMETRRSVLSLARRVIEPLLEGMALFAEFDTYPGSSAVLSPLLFWAAFLFARSEEMPELEPVPRLRYLLIAYRSHELAIKRKSDILVRPLATENGGYLIGYLAVKNCWHLAAERSPRLRDSDLFFTYMRNLIFGDVALADILLSDSSDETETVNRFSQRLHERLKLFASVDLDERVAKFEGALSETGELDNSWECLYLDNAAVEKTNNALSIRRREVLPGINSSEWTPQVGKSAPGKRQQLFEHLEKNLDPAFRAIDVYSRDDLDRAFVDFAQLVHRPLLRIRIDTVTVRVDAERNCTIFSNGVPVLTASAHPDAAQGEGEGKLAMYFLPDELAIVLVCIKKGMPVWTYFPESVHAVARDLALAAIGQVLLSEETRMKISEILDTNEALGKSPRFKHAFARAILNLYLDFALCFVANDKLNVCIKLLQQHGFWRLFDEDGDQVNSLAILGLISSFTTERALLDGLMAMHGLDLAGTVTRLVTAQRESGYPLLVPGKAGEVHCRV